MSDDAGFSFPQVQSASKVPLVARATVQAASSSGRSEPQPVKVTGGASTLEHRNKGHSEPLLTRVVYGLLNWMNNVPLEKGYSQVDWLRVSRSAPPPKIRRDITLAEVAQHRSREDAWMVFRNRVYNITPYLRFHPGGADILMKAAGKDGTALFLKYHAWVNIDALMEKCVVGFLAEEQQPGGVQGAPGPAASGPSPMDVAPGPGDAAATTGMAPPTFSQFPSRAAAAAKPTVSSQSAAGGVGLQAAGAGGDDDAGSAESAHRAGAAGF